MELTKFNLPVEIIDLIASLEPENQGIVYSHLFAYIYHDVEISEDVDPRCRLILRLIIEKLAVRVKRARQSSQRKANAPARKESPAAAPAQKSQPAAERSAVAARIVQNGRAVHDRVSDLGRALYEAQMRAESPERRRKRIGETLR